MLLGKFVTECKNGALVLHLKKMDLALLYCYNCNRKFFANLAFLPRVDSEFSIFLAAKNI